MKWLDTPMTPSHWLAVVIAGVIIAFTYFGLRALAWRVRVWWNTRYSYWNGRDEEIFGTVTVDPSDQTTKYLFRLPAGQRDERGFKTRAETNLNFGSMLGMPIEFDPASIEIYIVDASDGDVVELLKNCHFDYITGCQTRQATIPGMMFEPVVNVSYTPEGGLGAMTLSQVIDDLGWQKVWDATRHFSKKVDVRRITSCEQFEVHLEIVRPLKLRGPVTLKVALKGIEWRPGPVGPGTGPKSRRDKVRSMFLPVAAPWELWP